MPSNKSKQDWPKSLLIFLIKKFITAEESFAIKIFQIIYILKLLCQNTLQFICNVSYTLCNVASLYSRLYIPLKANVRGYALEGLLLSYFVNKSY